MKKSIEIKAATVDLAIEEGLLELNTTLEKVEVDVLNKGGLFQKAVIKMTTIESSAEIAENFVNGILKNMNLAATAKAEETDDCVTVSISGKDSGAAIGYRGEALDAIQYLTLTVVNNGEKGKFKKIVVNAENYREKREETLAGLANRLADKAFKLGKKIVLEPMNPYERRIIHSTLQNSDIAETTSEGEEPNRRVVIIPKGVEITGTIDSKREAYRGGERRGSDRRSDNRYDSRRSDGRRSGSGLYDGRRGDGRGDGRRRDGDRDRDRKPAAERHDSYEDYDAIESKKVEPFTYTPMDPVKKEGAPKFKSFGSKKFPF